MVSKEFSTFTIQKVDIMRDILDLNSLSLIEINIDGKLALSEFIEPDKPKDIQQILQTIKMKLQDIVLSEEPSKSETLK